MMKDSAENTQSTSPAVRTGPGVGEGHLVVFDTTLRDGEQSPGISLDVAEKLEIAEQLARVGVDYIEAGFPVASQGDFEAVQAIARSVGVGSDAPAICGLSRTQLSDVDRCWEALRDADQARIHVFISTSPQHMEHMLKMTEAQVLAETRGGVARAREHTDDVEFSPQDATRTPLDFMLEVLRAAVEAGATTLNIPDTVGYGIPWDFGALIQHVRKEVAGDYVLSTHCHNDHRAHRGARPRLAPGGPSDRVPGSVQQGDRGTQRFRPRVGYPSARCAGRPLHLRDHRGGQRRAGRSTDRAR
jgi:methylmalonyl-CoA mutase cobalamin-binding subunit